MMLKGNHNIKLFIFAVISAVATIVTAYYQYQEKEEARCEAKRLEKLAESRQKELLKSQDSLKLLTNAHHSELKIQGLESENKILTAQNKLTEAQLETATKTAAAIALMDLHRLLGEFQAIVYQDLENKTVKDVEKQYEDLLRRKELAVRNVDFVDKGFIDSNKQLLTAIDQSIMKIKDLHIIHLKPYLIAPNAEIRRIMVGQFYRNVFSDFVQYSNNVTQLYDISKAAIKGNKPD